MEREQAWKRTWMPATSARASIHQLHMMKYHDQLVEHGFTAEQAEVAASRLCNRCSGAAASIGHAADVAGALCDAAPDGVDDLLSRPDERDGVPLCLGGAAASPALSAARRC